MVIKIKNKFFSFICVFCICVSVFSANVTSVYADQTTKEVEVSTPQCMLVLGDSISTGFGLANYKSGNNYNTDSYANILASKYKLSQDSDYYNYAIDGQTSLELYSRVKSGSYDEEIKKSDLILISIGGNDLLSGLSDFITNTIGISFSEENTEFDFDFTDPEILNSLSQMINKINNNISKLNGNLIGITDEIYEINPDVQVVFQTVYNPLDGLKFELPSLLSDVFVSRIEEVNQIINANAQTEDNKQIYNVADIYTSFSGKSTELTNISENDIHPNAKGHEKISECIDEIVAQKTFYASVTINEKVPKAKTTSRVVKSPLFVPIIIMVSLVFIVALAAISARLLKNRRKR